ncbi:hypothetical protein [Streptomyces auratus]|uniref:hypothetical protein n=1 Tax=Streptomyces TaxID=1883 RepID=UPI003D23E9CD
MRDIAHTAAGPDGSALAALIAGLVWDAIVAGRWHEAKGHAHQADAAGQASSSFRAPPTTLSLRDSQNLAQRQPKETIRRTLASDVRAAIPERAEWILTDTGWPALAAVLADAEARGHKPHQLLKEAVAQRELTTARQPARALITRIQHTGRNPVTHRRAGRRPPSHDPHSLVPAHRARLRPSIMGTTAPAEPQLRQRR